MTICPTALALIDLAPEDGGGYRVFGKHVMECLDCDLAATDADHEWCPDCNGFHLVPCVGSLHGGSTPETTKGAAHNDPPGEVPS